MKATLIYKDYKEDESRVHCFEGENIDYDINRTNQLMTVFDDGQTLVIPMSSLICLQITNGKEKDK